MCHIDHSNSYKNLPPLSRKAVLASRKGKRPDKCSIVPCDDRSLVVVAPYNMPISVAVDTSKNLINLFKPERVISVALPRGSC